MPNLYKTPKGTVVKCTNKRQKCLLEVLLILTMAFACC